MRPMTDAKHLEIALHRLRAEIDALPLHDDETRQRLETLIGDIESSLDDPLVRGFLAAGAGASLGCAHMMNIILTLSVERK